MSDPEAMAKRLEDNNWTPGKPVSDDLNRWTTERAEAASLIRSQAERIRVLEADAKRLDFLDWLNRRLNVHYGTEYGWKLVTNHNVNRLILGSDFDVELHDSEGGNAKLDSCRAAIDQRMREHEAARARARAAMEPRNG